MRTFCMNPLACAPPVLKDPMAMEVDMDRFPSNAAPPPLRTAPPEYPLESELPHFVAILSGVFKEIALPNEFVFVPSRN